jgi:hypothetical protein
MTHLFKIKIGILIILILGSPFISAFPSDIRDTSFANSIDFSEYQTNEKISKIIQMINKTLIQHYLEELISIGPRMTGTYGCEKAGSYILKTFRKLNLEANAYLWEGFGNRRFPSYYQGYNIEGALHSDNPVTDEVIIFNAHYDTVEDTVGANDDGSGVVGVLAAAYALSHFSFNHTIKFVAFSGEEIGLLGSTYYVKHLYEQNEDILVEFNADMIGGAHTSEEGRSIRLSYSEDTEWIIEGMQNILQSYNTVLNLQITRTYPYNRESKRGGSDYFPFILYGYESIAFWQAASDPNMHTPEDDLSNVNISYLVNTTRLIAATIAFTADMEDRPIKMNIVCPKKGKLYINDRNIKPFKKERTWIINDKWVYLDIHTFNAPVERVEFYLDEKLKHTIYDIPYVWNLNILSFGNHKLTVIAYDEKGGNATDQIIMFLWNINPFK